MSMLRIKSDEVRALGMLNSKASPNAPSAYRHQDPIFIPPIKDRRAIFKKEIT